MTYTRKQKILNDPVYGFVEVPYGILFDLIEHPWFQRLRRIKQLGLTHYVYPGALHTRFHHALGALHLMRQAVSVLRSKGVEISEQEAEAVSIAVLLHDVGHGPFSHTLEHVLVRQVHHEALSVLFMQQLNEQFDGKLQLAIEIFQDRYSRRFFHQLVSGQLDMDRMDYLSRDSFFTGVYEGVIGYDRIIKMLHVADDQLVVEEKGVYAVEKFLMARRLMYWQVYLHKTVVCAEQMLVRTLQRAQELAMEGAEMDVSPALRYFFNVSRSHEDVVRQPKLLLEQFAQLDDFDVVSALKSFTQHTDTTLSFLAKGLINRRLFKLILQSSPFERDQIENIRLKVQQDKQLTKADLKYLVFQGKESNRTYSTAKDEIHILFKNGRVRPMSTRSDLALKTSNITKYYLCYPKNINYI